MASSNPLAGAQEAMKKANTFTKSVEGTTPSRFAPKPSGQHAAAPYKMAKSAGPKPSSEIQDTAQGLADKQKNVQDYLDSQKQ